MAQFKKQDEQVDGNREEEEEEIQEIVEEVQVAKVLIFARSFYIVGN